MTQKRTVLPLLLVFQLVVPSLQAYDDVRLTKIIPLVDRKTVPGIVRLDKNKQPWILGEENQTIQQISPEGKASVVLMPGKKANALFKSPIDFGFMSDGSLVVADPGLERVAVIAPEKISDNPTPKDWKKTKLVYSFPAKGVTAVAVSADDVIAVGYEDQLAIDVFSADGVLLHRLYPSEKYQLKKVVSMAYGANGQLWVLEQSKGVLHRFSADRKWLGALDGFENPHSIAVDEYGFAYVSLSPGRWREVNPDGTLAGVFGTKGKNPGEMLTPKGIATIDSTQILVSETGNGRLQIFRINNKDKKSRLFREPAAHVQVRHISQWEDQVQGGLVHPNGSIFLLNSDRNVFEWVNDQGESKSSVKKKGKGTGGFVHPHSMVLDDAGKIWVSDQGDHTLKKMSDTGDIERTLGQKGKKEGGLKSPSFLSVRSDGSVVVADKDNSRVQVLSPNGLFLFQVGTNGKKEGQISSLVGLASNSELIALLDGARRALIFYDASGKFVSEITNKEGKAPYWSEPASIACDSEGRFYVLDNGSKRVRIFNRKGQFLADFSSKGQNISCGIDHKVLVTDLKTVSLYTVRLVPKALQNVAAADVDGDLQITWDKNFEAKEYAIYRSSAGGGAATVVTKVAEPPFVDRDVTPGVTYTYGVVGVNDAGNEGNWAESKPVKAPKRKDVSLISIQKIDLKPVFTAANKYYVKNPIGTITVRNNDDKSFRNVKITLGLKKYCDFPTEIVVPDLAAGEEKGIPVTMTFNDSIFELTEDTPVQMDVRVSYFEDNTEKSISQNAPITLYSRNTIAWSEKDRIASFITPKDPPIVEFARTAIRDNMLLLKGSTVTRPLAKAALFYESMNALGISYVPDPKTPFTEVSKNPDVLDYVQFPRETLRRKTGDCDDTTALLAALLESVGVSVALIDMPGHILLMANTEESDIAVIGLPAERFIRFQGTYWVPIETTRLGQDFAAAWQSGIATVLSAKDPSQIRYMRVEEAMEKFPPVTLVAVEKDSQAFPADKVRGTFPPVLTKLQEERYEALLKDIKKEIKDNPVDHMLQVRLGMIQVEGGHAAEGRQTFISLLKEDEAVEVQSAARNNLGNLAYLDGDYKEAFTHYEKGLILTPDDGGIMVNKARTAWRLGDKETAVKTLEQAKQVYSDWQDFAADIPAEYLPK